MWNQVELVIVMLLADPGGHCPPLHLMLPENQPDQGADQIVLPVLLVWVRVQSGGWAFAKARSAYRLLDTSLSVSWHVLRLLMKCGW